MDGDRLFPWVALPLAFVAASTLFLYKGAAEAGPSPTFSFHPAGPAMAWLVAVVAAAAFCLLGWAWKAQLRRMPLAAAAIGLVASIALTGCAVDVHSAATMCSGVVPCDAAPFGATANDAIISIVLSILAVAASALLALVCLEDLTRRPAP